jgi:UDP-N-acetylmuramoylalanine--D-glutamate ligase
LSEAVQAAFVAARPGEVVLLSPACASYDQFRNFVERGRLFKQLVFALGT